MEGEIGARSWEEGDQLSRLLWGVRVRSGATARGGRPWGCCDGVPASDSRALGVAARFAGVVLLQKLEKSVLYTEMAAASLGEGLVTVYCFKTIVQL